MVTIVTMVAILGIALPTAAQAPQGLPGPIGPPHFLPTEDRAWAVRENYTLELTAGLWSPAPAISASSEQFGIIGSMIDFQNDLGLVQQRHGEFRMTFKPGRRHKLRLHYLPMRYQQSGLLERTLVFQGIRYDIGLPVDSSFTWDTWRFGYELDVVTFNRGYVGLLIEAKYTDLQVDLQSAVANEYVRARAPIPALGAIGRVYVMRNTPITFEFTAFKMPDDLVQDYNARLVDIDVYGTYNLTEAFGVNVGYRSMDLSYIFDRDAGDLRVEGIYFSGAFRF